MLDWEKYSIDEPYREFGNGYDQLEGEWLLYYKVASKFCHKARYEDRDDLLHTIILNLAVAGRNDGHKPDNASWMYRIASFTVAQYWRDYYYRVNGIDCGHCSNQQRKRCKEQNLYPDYCHRAIKIDSFSTPVSQSNDTIELWETLADDNAIDLDAWLDAKTWLAGCPERLVGVASKKTSGKPLSHKEQVYLSYQREKELKKRQKVLTF